MAKFYCSYQKGSYPSDQCYTCNYVEDCWDSDDNEDSYGYSGGIPDYDYRYNGRDYSYDD